MRYSAAFLFLLTYAASFGQQISLSLSSGSTAPGGTVSLSMDLALNGGIQPASLQWTLSYSQQDFASVQVSATPATTIAGKSISCTASAGSASCVLLGMNINPLSSGVLALVTLQVSPATGHQSAAIDLANVVAASPQAAAIPAARKTRSKDRLTSRLYSP